jgi:hypothetical protein
VIVDDFPEPICGDGPPFCVVCTPVGELCDYDGHLMTPEDEARARAIPVEQVVAARQDAS